MKCEHCGAELVDGVAGAYEADGAHCDHTEARCLRAQLAAERATAQAERERREAAEQKLIALAEHGITIDPVTRFEAFTPEAMAAYPSKPKWLIRTRGEELRTTEALAQLAAERERREAAGRNAETFRQSQYALEERVGDLRAQLAERDATIARLAKWIVQHGKSRGPDHACAQCVPGGPIVDPDFVCAYHVALAETEKP